MSCLTVRRKDLGILLSDVHLEEGSEDLPGRGKEIGRGNSTLFGEKMRFIQHSHQLLCSHEISIFNC